MRAPRSRPHRALILSAILGLSGCSALPFLLPRPKEQASATPTEDGAQYVTVSVPRASSASLVRSKWKKTAREACDGEYVVLSEDSAQRRTGGVVRGRMHEGFVRCVSPEKAVPTPATKRGPKGPATAAVKR